jgi:hypothetical protein
MSQRSNGARSYTSLIITDFALSTTPLSFDSAESMTPVSHDSAEFLAIRAANISKNMPSCAKMYRL